MKTVDNFKLISSLLDFPTEDVFYFGQIIQRRKDNPDIGADNIVLRDFYFESIEKFWRKENEIKGFCEHFHARAYIHLNKRSKEAVAFEALKTMVDHIAKKEFQSLRSVYATACGQKVSDDNKKWILDIDFDNPILEREMIGVIYYLEPVGEKILATIPTVNGKHYIVRPFNSQKFAQDCLFAQIEDFSLQKNNPTLLYCKI